jgi:hypothetical protein
LVPYRDTLNAAKSASDILWDGSTDKGEVPLGDWVRMYVFGCFVFVSFRFGLSVEVIGVTVSVFLPSICVYAVCFGVNTNHHQQPHRLVDLFTSPATPKPEIEIEIRTHE